MDVEFFVPYSRIVDGENATKSGGPLMIKVSSSLSLYVAFANTDDAANFAVSTRFTGSIITSKELGTLQYPFLIDGEISDFVFLDQSALNGVRSGDLAVLKDRVFSWKK